MFPSAGVGKHAGGRRAEIYWLGGRLSWRDMRNVVP